ncbi:MAG: HAD-IIB family hydrolase [Hydrogenophaga sp.]|uniref:HAD-IIB family hydrolase n=1 Tax=Hydrogenophaga sp. TaxID=1904254 RepID=UPI001DC5F2F6|nr:HAD-IIB family hydrolase [Hydrogenophaga sp.]MBX3611193.1 HAD-IIB family hydrolase [Hydrogenophaga sp.]
MQSLSRWPVTERARISGVFTDIDDTLTHDGAIAPEALAALAQLRAAGIDVFAITGRPVGWSLPFAQGPQAWPVQAIVAENGAVALLPDGSRRYLQDAPERAANFAHLQRVLARIEAEVPGAQRATDSAGRETDIAIDHSEFTHLDDATIARVVDLMRAEGLRVSVSSIHINGWIGEHDKLVGARWVLQACLDRTLDAEPDRWVYVGDSTNDQVMFEHFRHSVGVANIARFVPQLRHLPVYVTDAERGQGFAELAHALLSARQP